VPVPKLIWTLDGHTEPVKNAALVDTLSNAYMNASAYNGLLSQASDMLRD
jgi:hypothetical protein